MGFSLPHDVAVVAVRVAALSTLSNDDQKRAVALALTREFAVRADKVMFTFASLAPSDSDTAIVAYTKDSEPNRLVDLSWAPAVADGTVLWVQGVSNNETRSSQSWLLSNRGAIALEGSEIGGSNNHQVPVSLMALAGDRARAGKALNVGLVGNPLGEETEGVEQKLAHWSAALGASFARREIKFSGSRAALEPAPVAKASASSTRLQGALNVALAASLVCASLAALRWASVPAAPSVANAPVRSGELWYRAGVAAPELQEHMRDATFAGGAWLIAAPSLPVTSVDRVSSALRSSALTTQIVREPELRLRVQAP